jgi:hypothetical protein
LYFRKLSTAQTELRHEASIALDILAAEVVEQTPALSHQHEEPTTAVMVVLVGPQMLSEMIDAFGKQSYLDLWGSGVGVVLSEFGDDLRCGLHCA